ncbi:MAG: DNA-processing protein DprA [Bacteroidales bacterium]
MQWDSSLNFWIGLAHTYGIKAVRKMDLLIELVHKQGLSLDRAVESAYSGKENYFLATEKEKEMLGRMIADAAMNDVIVRNLQEKGIRLLTVMDPAYPAIVKKLQKKTAPLLLYVHGDPALLNKPTTGIEGIRDTSPLSLRFTDTVARAAMARGDVIVGGLINPVEKKALDYALYGGGSAVLLLAEGINRFKLPEYDRFVAEGRLAIVSFMHPDAERNLRTTMDRNMLFYDFCTHAFIAQSSAIGGGWDGAVNSLSKRPVYVRVEAGGEENFNNLLISNGGIAVDENGIPGDFEALRVHMATLPDNPVIPFRIDSPVTAAEYAGFLRKRLEKMQTLSLSDFFKENTLSDRIRFQLENIFNLSPDLEKIRVGNKVVYTIKGAIPRQGSLF